MKTSTLYDFIGKQINESNSECYAVPESLDDLSFSKNSFNPHISFRNFKRELKRCIKSIWQHFTDKWPLLLVWKVCCYILLTRKWDTFENSGPPLFILYNCQLTKISLLAIASNLLQSASKYLGHSLGNPYSYLLCHWLLL